MIQLRRRKRTRKVQCAYHGRATAFFAMPSPVDPSRDRYLDARISRVQGGRCVILLHTLPDGTSHFDWMLETIGDESGEETADQRSLICFRSPKRPDELEPREEIAVERLPDHRRRYLDFEGPISGDRGQVKRVAQGTIIRVKSSVHSMDVELLLKWDAAPRFASHPCWLRLSPTQDAAEWNVLCIDSREVAT